MRELTLDEMDRVSGGTLWPTGDVPGSLAKPPQLDNPFGATEFGLWGDLVGMVKHGQLFTAIATAATNLPILAGEAVDAAIAASAPQGAYNCAKSGDCSGLVPKK